MNCPVCNSPNLKTGDITCPDCLSELEAFDLIRDTDRQFVQLNKDLEQQRSRNKILMIVAVILVLIWIVTFALHDQMFGVDEANKAKIEEQAAEIEGLKSEVSSLEDEKGKLKDDLASKEAELKTALEPEPEEAEEEEEVEKLSEEPASEAVTKEPETVVESKVNATPTSGTVPESHTLGEGESLWKLAEQYYGDGLMFLKIAEENNLDNPDIIAPGTVIKLPKN